MPGQGWPSIRDALGADVERTKQVAIFAALLVYFVVAVVETRNYGSEASIVPLLIGVPAIVLTLVQIGRIVRPDLFPTSQNLVFNIDEFVDDDIVERSTEDTEGVTYHRFALTLALFAAYAVSLYLVGFVVSSLVWFSVQKYVISGGTMLRSGLFGVALTVCVYVLMFEIVGVLTFESLLLPSIP